MAVFFSFLLLLSLFFLLLGLISPKASLFWSKGERTRKKSSFIFGGMVILLFILVGATADRNHETSAHNSVQKETHADNKSKSDQEAALTQYQKDSIENAERIQRLETIKKNTISARQLTAAYEANEVNADTKFRGKTIYVSGKVTDIKKDILDNIYVILEGNELFRDVQCYFDDVETASKLTKGMNVTFIGKCDGLMMNVQLKNCELVAVQ